jgi:hypothetical protein
MYEPRRTITGAQVAAIDALGGFIPRGRSRARRVGDRLIGICASLASGNSLSSDGVQRLSLAPR